MPDPAWLASQQTLAPRLVKVFVRREAPGRYSKRLIRKVLRSRGYDLVPRHAAPGPSARAKPLPDMDEETAATWAAVQPYTLTSAERIAVLCDLVRYLERARVPGAFVECGVWRGGSVLAMIRTLLSLGVPDRELYLYDTFSGMPSPDSVDVDCYGTSAAEQHAWLERGGPVPKDYAYLPLDEVRALLGSTGYPGDHVHFVKGLVEDTIPAQAPDRIALLRLDTDYYKSTKHELEHLFPRLAPGGALIVDDYGHWAGSQLATDEHVQQLNEQGIHLFLQRVDYSCRLAIVPPAVSVPRSQAATDEAA